MNLSAHYQACTLLFLLSVCLMGACVMEEPEEDLYIVYELSGFEVRVEKRAFDINEERTLEAIDLLSDNL